MYKTPSQSEKHIIAAALAVGALGAMSALSFVLLVGPIQLYMAPVPAQKPPTFDTETVNSALKILETFEIPESSTSAHK